MSVRVSIIARLAVAAAGLTAAVPAMAGELTPEQAKRFVAGKLFAYQCFDGTTGMGRIHKDGSVAGTIRARGGETRRVALPANTIRVSSNSICASVRGMPFQPCFNVVQTSAASFRGSLSGLGFAYCEFTRINPRVRMADAADTGDKPRARTARNRPVLNAPVKPVSVADAPPLTDGIATGE